MEELFVLTEEHEAIRQRLDELEGLLQAVGSNGPGAVERLVHSLHQTVVLARDIHQPKEQAVFLARVGTKAGIQKCVLDAAVGEENRLIHALAELLADVEAHGIRSASLLGVRLLPLLSAMRHAMDWEDQVLYPLAYLACNEEDLWDLSVALDRAVDAGGRALRETNIAPLLQGIRLRAAACC